MPLPRIWLISSTDLHRTWYDGEEAQKTETSAPGTFTRDQWSRILAKEGENGEPLRGMILEAARGATGASFWTIYKVKVWISPTKSKPGCPCWIKAC